MPGVEQIEFLDEPARRCSYLPLLFVVLFAIQMTFIVYLTYSAMDLNLKLLDIGVKCTTDRLQNLCKDQHDVFCVCKTPS
jgi:hypothetical protein